ncbi:nucleotide-binding domain-containing protein [Dendrothele bispora CBS 962.96]|uniref:Nucleotide-binding domain-containing protein n=1 Tax=Dendrothele bispora (strain CBS 962.96) TaxID=1314807 RepID=A0A4S8L3K0_DENBC|nr:nucleotide-binding domain-containing protein [Dendrothele bispora CBS 962.96]
MSTPKRIVVLGAGVIGLSTAVRIQEEGKGKYEVTVVAATLPTDEKCIEYTSWWAGAQIVTLETDDERYRKIQKDTFEEMWKLATAAEEGDPDTKDKQIFKKVTDRRYHETKVWNDSLPLDQVHPCGYMPGFRYLSTDELATISGRTLSSVLSSSAGPRPPAQGTEFTTVTVHSLKYLLWLKDRFTKAGGRFFKSHVGHIRVVLEGLENEKGVPSPPPDAVIVCTGLGTRSLGGVEDKDMYPIRGQTVIINAPWVNEMPEMYYSVANDELGDETGITYIIPRADGSVIVGGTFHEDDWYPHPRPQIAKRILERAVKFYPQLASPQVREAKEKEGQEIGLEDVQGLVIENGVGLRPARKGGIRLEVEKMEWDPKDGKGVRKTPVVFNYGHSSGGFQCSWGSANVALELLESAL